jgi:membrane protein DedA with SNARE-associated domain
MEILNGCVKGWVGVPACLFTFTILTLLSWGCWYRWGRLLLEKLGISKMLFSKWNEIGIYISIWLRALFPPVPGETLRN